MAYNDSSSGNLIDEGSQGGFVIYIVTKEGNCSPLMWQSRKLRRVVKSAMAPETLSQVDSADAAFWLEKLFNELLHANPEKAQVLPTECFTDSRQLFETVRDKRLRTDIAILHEMIEKKELAKIKW